MFYHNLDVYVIVYSDCIGPEFYGIKNCHQSKSWISVKCLAGDASSKHRQADGEVPAVGDYNLFSLKEKS